MMAAVMHPRWQAMTEARRFQRTEGPRMVLTRLVVSHTAFAAALLLAFVTPPGAGLLWAAAAVYVLRVFAVEGGMHRYFSHRSYRTSRTFQGVLAVLAASGGQRGPIWWAIVHRRHHKHSDTALDPHSPLSQPWHHAYFGWLLNQDMLDTDLDAARDLSRFPELVWINQHHWVFPLLSMAITAALGEFTSLFGAPGQGGMALLWVFFVPVVLAQHAPYLVNTLGHGRVRSGFSRRRHATDDASLNLWWLALPTLGAAWHNNHHRCMNAARAGFAWYEIDLCWWMLRGLALLGIVWDLQPVPQAVLDERRRGAAAGGDRSNGAPSA